MNAEMDRFRRTLEDTVEGEIESYNEMVGRSIVASLWNAMDDERGRLLERVAELEAALATTKAAAQKLVDGWKQASGEHAVFAKSEALSEYPGMADKQEGRSLQLLDCADELADVLKGEDPDDWEHGIGMDVADRDERTPGAAS